MHSRARLRLEKELIQIKKSHPNLQVFVSDDDSLKWRVCFEGPAESIYAGEFFTLSFDFGDTYPIESPEVIFIGRPPIHEHIYSNGFICLSTLYNGKKYPGWKPTMTVASTVLSISSMLSTAKRKKKPKDDKAVVKETKGQKAKDQKWEFHDSGC